jgi:dinuclear metal center YbgI/SA1388 family protein
MALKSIFPIDTQTYLGNIIKKAIKNDITIYSAHTNFDSVEPTVSDALLKKLSFEYSELSFLETGRESNIGFGRIIKLKKKMASSDILNAVKDKTFAKYLRFVGDIDKVIERIAIMGGSGASFIEDVHKQGVDLYITGDVKYHDARLAEQLGLFVIDLGHFYSEKYSLSTLKELLDMHFKEIFIDIFNKEDDPFILWR